MGKIGYGYGSEWHLLRFLGYHRDYLSKEILKITVGEDISWIDFGFSKNSAFLNNDQELVGLEFIQNTQVFQKWREFWPPTGSAQNWDAVGKIEYENHQEWLLVEAKAHLDEVRSNCGANSPKSIEMISGAFEKTMQSFCDNKTPINNWLSPYYQYANRLASLHFLMRECDPAIPTRLLFIYFCGDQRPDKKCPQKEEEWHKIIEDMEAWLGIDQSKDIYKRIHHLFLPVNPNVND